MAPCAECGCEYEALGRDEVLAAVPSLAGQHARLLRSVAEDRLRAHPRRGWSPLEYGCHLRDMLVVQRERVVLAQAEQTPRFASMRRDERAVEEAYNEQDASVVADQIVAAADALTRTMAALDDAGGADRRLPVARA